MIFGRRGINPTGMEEIRDTGPNSAAVRSFECKTHAKSPAAWKFGLNLVGGTLRHTESERYRIVAMGSRLLEALFWKISDRVRRIARCFAA